MGMFTYRYSMPEREGWLTTSERKQTRRRGEKEHPFTLFHWSTTADDDSQRCASEQLLTWVIEWLTPARGLTNCLRNYGRTREADARRSKTTTNCLYIGQLILRREGGPNQSQWKCEKNELGRIFTISTISTPISELVSSHIFPHNIFYPTVRTAIPHHFGIGFC